MRYLIILLVLAGFFLSCKNESQKKMPDVSKIKVEAELLRYDKVVFSAQADLITTSFLDSIIRLDPVFAELYFKRILAFRSFSNPATDPFVEEFKSFIQDSAIAALQQLSSNIFTDTKTMEADLHKACQFFNYHFPNKPTPKFVSFISEFGVSNFIYSPSENRDGLAFGLDFFLGQSYPYIQLSRENPAFSAYLNRSFNKDHLVKKTFEPLVDDICGKAEGDNLMQLMMHEGKKLYILKEILPFVHDTVIFEYTPEQLNWCFSNQVEIWAFLHDQKLLFNSELNKIQKFYSASPNSPGMPEIAPGRTGNFIGYLIILKYMEKNPNTSLSDLIALKDSQIILEKARFKPKNVNI